MARMNFWLGSTPPDAPGWSVAPVLTTLIDAGFADCIAVSSDNGTKYPTIDILRVLTQSGWYPESFAVYEPAGTTREKIVLFIQDNFPRGTRIWTLDGLAWTEIPRRDPLDAYALFLGDRTSE